MHASTQLTVHNVSGAWQAKELGFSRVVLAREMSREEILQVTTQVPVETEVFVHGALCMCVSGQCYMSSVIGELQRQPRIVRTALPPAFCQRQKRRQRLCALAQGFEPC